jgi:hypothetical protein
MYAIQKGFRGTVQKMLAAGANLELVDNPALVAAKGGDAGVMEMLVQAKVNLEATDDVS